MVRVSDALNQNPAFDKIFQRTLGFEGGYTVDHAGPTNYGVTQGTFDAYRRKNGMPIKSVKEISIDEAKDVYRRDYYEGPGFYQLNEEVGGVLFDYGVNAGPRVAAKALQRAVGSVPDGVIGPVTIEAVNKFIKKNGEGSLIEQILVSREKHNQSLIDSNHEKYGKFAKGWQNRVNKLRAEYATK